MEFELPKDGLVARGGAGVERSGGSMTSPCAPNNFANSFEGVDEKESIQKNKESIMMRMERTLPLMERTKPPPPTTTTTMSLHILLPS